MLYKSTPFTIKSRVGGFALTERYILYICFVINVPKLAASVKSPILQVLPGVQSYIIHLASVMLPFLFTL